MVTRPRLSLRIAPMTVADIPGVQSIERASFPVPWPPYAFRQELETNRLAHYRIVRAGPRIVAYGGLWMMVGEAHITSFAVDPAWRRRGVGTRLLLALADLAIEQGADTLTLEVRLSNEGARALYARAGFRPVGIRPRYYADNNEDALIMTTEPLGSPGMVARLAALRAAVADADTDADTGSGPGAGGERG
ncbi:MAG: ribosomal protein S18-alanine N-acetyltransferase [Chloroflexota bacterium]